MADNWTIRRGSPVPGTSPLRPPAESGGAERPSAPVEEKTAPALAPTQASFSAASRTGSLSLPSLEAAAQAVDAALSLAQAESVADPLQRRLHVLVSPGVPVRLDAGDQAVEVFWPYPPGSRHGGPEALSSQGASESFRDHMAPLAAYFGAGTHGPLMAWMGDRAALGELPKGSDATQALQAIASTLFWDVPMQQASDDRLIARGMPVDLSEPEAMARYLTHQRDVIAGLVARQTPEADGPAYMRAGRELLAMVEAAVRRVEGFMAGDRSPLTATPLGPYGWYNQASEPGQAMPISSESVPDVPPQVLREAALRIEQDFFSAS